MKKAIIFDQYLNMLGGGERYALSFASELKKLGYSVEIAWEDSSTLTKATERFGIDFSGIKANAYAFKIFSSKKSLIKKYQLTRGYDLIFWISDGSLPFLFSNNNLVHFQVPFKKLGGNLFLNKIKSLFVNKFVYNSEFTKKVLEKRLSPQKSHILYPPIDINSLEGGKKEKIILSVSRFSSIMTSKRQDILIEAFRKFSRQIKDYKLILTGGLAGDDSIISDLKKQSSGLNVLIIPNPSFTKLKELYSKSKFFWHAAGFGIDEEKEPEKVEHFGMTTVEAMASGCIPIVINKGGQKEILSKIPQLLSETDDQLVSKTLNIAKNSSIQANLTGKLVVFSKKYSLEAFKIGILSLLK